MKTLYLSRYTRSKFQNPFMLKKFYYKPTEKWYRCGSEHIQTLLYIWLYAFGNWKKYQKLFYINDDKEGFMELPLRPLDHIFGNIHKEGGLVHNNEFATAMDALYLRLLQEDLLPQRGPKSVFESKIQTIVYQLYPNINKELSKKYPDIKLFL